MRGPSFSDEYLRVYTNLALAERDARDISRCAESANMKIGTARMDDDLRSSEDRCSAFRALEAKAIELMRQADDLAREIQKLRLEVQA